MIHIRKNAPYKWPNLLESLLNYLSDFHEELKEHYSLHLNSQILWQSVKKFIENHNIFMKKSQKKFYLLKNTENSAFVLDLMLRQVLKSNTRQWWPGMAKETCNQHLIRRHGVRTIFVVDCSLPDSLSAWLHSVNWSNFIVWLTLHGEILSNKMKSIFHHF